LKSTSAALAAGALGPACAAVEPAVAFHPGGTETLRVGLVGCGGRGTGAAVNAMRADPNARLVAMGDAFADHVEGSLRSLEAEDVAPQLAVDAEHRFTGFDAYRRVIDACDVVLLCTSPHFRPLHLRYAVEKGVHVFCEKPAAVDAPGVRSVLESARIAVEKRLSLVSGLCYRYESAKRETVARIQDGAIGEIRALQCTYNTGGLWHRGRQPAWSDMEWQMRNWLYFTWLSGDHVVEQHIHSLDKIAWVMGGYPERCVASGGRAQRTDPKFGNVYDHFNTVYTWPSGVKLFSSCRQWVNAAGDVSDHVWGTRGVAHLQQHAIEGESPWRWRAPEGFADDMYQSEHDALFASIRAGEPIANGEYMAHSTLMAIMARMAAYTGQEITWQQALASQEDLTPKSYEWGPLDVAPVAIPGVTPFV
jgi:predicted dehydrogenase